MKKKEDLNPLKLSDLEWQKKLSAEAHHVLRAHGTESPFSSDINDEDREGVYRCAGCGLPLFKADDKFDAGCGWPSFSDTPYEEHVVESEDTSHGMERTEVHCARCAGHLGHLFTDGPEPTGLRYCINGVSLSFQPQELSDSSQAANSDDDSLDEA